MNNSERIKCGWANCQMAAEKTAFFNKRIFEIGPGSASSERRNLCVDHLMVVRGIYQEVHEQEPSHAYQIAA